MKEQRAFWISGLACVAVVLLMGGALLARSQSVEPGPSPAASSMSQPSEAQPEQEAIRQELQVAYADLDQAYREIESLQAESTRHSQHEDDDDDDEAEDREEEERYDARRGEVREDRRWKSK
jgi:DNA-directed RNA polymerase specialized sigma subunit